MHFFAEYGLFLLKTLTLVIAILITVLGIVAIAAKNKHEPRGKIKIKNLNKKFDAMRESLEEELLDKKALKQAAKEKSKQEKLAKNLPPPKIAYVLHFHGDIRADHVNELREEVTAILQTATSHDEVIVCVESAGGLVYSYGLAAAQLQRIRAKGIPLTVCVDKIAASGGYMMAAVADQIIAAPFAIIGSIGVVAQLPNFNRWLSKHNVDFEQLTAGEYKRTLTMFGKNTSRDRAKFQEQLEDTHQLFKAHLHQFRPQLAMEKVATGEYWYGTQAFELRLVDRLQTSDDYLLLAASRAKVLEIKYHARKSKLANLLQNVTKLWQKPALSDNYNDILLG